MKKKGVFIMFLLCFGFIVIKSDKPIIRTDKVIFESRNLNYLSTDEDYEDELSDTELLEFQVFFNYDEFTYPELENPNPTFEEAKAYKKALRDAGKTYHSSRNQKLAKNLKITEMDNYYISEYGPAADFYLTKDEFLDNPDLVYEIANKQSVSCIFVNHEVERFNHEMLGALMDMGTYTQYSNNELDATDIVIGILEPSVLNKNHSNFSGCDVVVRDEWYYFETVHDHTTSMGSIIGGNNGIARGSKLRSVELSGDAISEFDWLLSKDVDIVNMSYGDSNPNGKYSSDSAYVDFIAYTYKVIMVAAVGNMGETTANVSNPALAYNCISVGSADWEGVDGYSSYKVVSGPKKPTIMTNGHSIYTPGMNRVSSGTSNSCAITTGHVAVLLKKQPLLGVNPERLFALLASGCTPIYWYDNYDNAGMDEYTGFGYFDYSLIEPRSFNTACVANTSVVNGEIVIGNYVNSLATLTHGKFAYATLVKSTGSNINNVVLQDYDICIYNNTTNQLVARTHSATSNVEVVHWPCTQNQVFKVVLKTYNINPLPDYYSRSYMYHKS